MEARSYADGRAGGDLWSRALPAARSLAGRMSAMKEEFAEPLQQVERVYARARGRKLLYFGGCDYYRLSSDRTIIKALHDGLDRHGLNPAASRITTGNHVLYEQVERVAARYFGARQAILLSSGYLANIAVAQALRGQVDRALIDERSHGSLRDALRLADCAVTEFRHREPQDLARKLAKFKSGSTMIVTDGLFAASGSIAPLREYRAVAGPRRLLWVDDAHAGGVLGHGGRGSIEHCEVPRANVIQTVTFSKAFGVYGGAVLCERGVARALIVNSSAVAGNTPLPLPLCSGVLQAFKELSASRRGRLRRKIAIFWRCFGAPAEFRESPIVGATVARPEALSDALLAAGIYPSFIRYPGGPAHGYFRFALSSEHAREHIERLARVLRSGKISLLT